MIQTEPVTLRPSRGWVPLNVGELLQFRSLLFAFAVRDVKLRYKQTLLGVAWVILQPLLAAAIFTFVFGVVAGMKTSNGQSYLLFSFAGLLIWNVFSSTLTKVAVCMVGNANLVTKVYFPRLILPFSTAGSTAIDFAVSAVFFLAMLLALGGTPTAALLTMPVWVLLAFALAMGLGLIAAALTVEYRDVQYILPLVTPFLLYASPVAYEVGRVPERFRTVYYAVNPLAGLIEAFRWSAVGATAPDWRIVTYAALVSGLVLIAGLVFFRRTERRVADVL
jgi:lipopolysaccharide transport system permease protein